jgi:hypothetical protein
LENGMTLDSLMQRDYNSNKTVRSIGIQDSFSKIIEITKIQMRDAAKRVTEKNVARSKTRTTKLYKSA